MSMIFVEFFSFQSFLVRKTYIFILNGGYFWQIHYSLCIGKLFYWFNPSQEESLASSLLWMWNIRASVKERRTNNTQRWKPLLVWRQSKRKYIHDVEKIWWSTLYTHRRLPYNHSPTRVWEANHYDVCSRLKESSHW